MWCRPKRVSRPPRVSGDGQHGARTVRSEVRSRFRATAAMRPWGKKVAAGSKRPNRAAQEREYAVARIGDGTDLLKCSFCGKSQKQVKKLIAGPGVYICDECIDRCNEIIEEEIA